MRLQLMAVICSVGKGVVKSTVSQMHAVLLTSSVRYGDMICVLARGCPGLVVLDTMIRLKALWNAGPSLKRQI